MTQEHFEKMMLECTKEMPEHKVTNHCLLIMCRIMHDIERQLNLVNVNMNKPKSVTHYPASGGAGGGGPVTPVGYDGGGIL